MHPHLDTAHAAWQTLGTQLGTNAWPGIAYLTGLLVIAAGLLAIALGRHHEVPHAAPPAQDNPALRLGLTVGAWLLLGWLFSLFASGLGDGRAMGEFDDALSVAIGQHAPLAVREAFGHFTHIGDPWPVSIAVAILAIWLWVKGHRAYAVAWVAATGGNALFNLGLKQIFERVRPEHDTTLAQAAGYSFPSGHTSGAVVTWGMLAYLVLRLAPARWHVPMVMLSAAMVIGIAASRVFLQVHYATDVLAGLCSGTAWLLLCITVLHLAERSHHA